MAQRKRAKARTLSVRRVYKKTRSYAKKSIKGTSLIQPDSMIYGAGRRYLSQLITPVTSRLGVLGTLSENAVLGTGLWLIAKKSSGAIKNIAIKGLVAENVLAGDDIAQMIMNKGSNTTQSSGSVW